jgi:hypothetical protein
VGVIHQPKNFCAKSEMAKPWEHSLSDAHHLCILNIIIISLVLPSPEEESSMIFEIVVMAKNFEGCFFVSLHDLV